MELHLQNLTKQYGSQCAVDHLELTLPTSQAERLTERLNVSNLRNLPQGQSVLRIVSDRMPSPRAQASEPNLEDLYLYLYNFSESQ